MIPGSIKGSKKWVLGQTKPFVVGFFSGIPTGLIILLTFYSSFDTNTLDKVFSRDRCSVSRTLENEYAAMLVQQRANLLEQVLANITAFSQPTELQSREAGEPNASCNQALPSVAPVSEVVVYKDVVLKEWELSTVAGVTEDEAKGETVLGEVARRFVPLGTGNFLFVKFGAYRTGPRSFGVVGLGARSMQKSWRDPRFECIWENSSGDVERGTGTKYLAPDAEFDGQYVTVVVQCWFERDVGVDGEGGDLRMVADHGYDDQTRLESVSFVALTEAAGKYDASLFHEPYQYEYVYCGSSLFADYDTVSLSPQRMREWLTYHMMLFGPQSHFILYDAGGINEEVKKVLEPWLKLGRVTVMNIRQQNRYMNVYHNQFLMLNDCLYRAKTLARWAFFFDVDEFLHVDTRGPYPPELLQPASENGGEEAAAATHEQEISFHDIISRLEKLGRRATSVVFQQRPMDAKHCVASNKTESELQSLWGMEKLVFRRRVEDIVWTHWQDHKFGAQVQFVHAVGIHDATHVAVPKGMDQEATITFMWMTYEGCGNCLPGDILHYYHYHNSVNIRTEVCREFVDPSIKVLNITGPIRFDNGTYEFDDTMALHVADRVKKFEIQIVGQQPTII